MENTSFRQWCDWLKEYRHLPYLARFEWAENHLLTERGTPLSWEPLWQQAGSECAFVLESGKNGDFTYAGIQPQDTISGNHADGLEALKKWLAPYRSPHIPECRSFQGGCVGYFSYDMARSLEKLPVMTADDLHLPDYFFARYDRLWVIDHQRRFLYCIVYTHLDDFASTDQDSSLTGSADADSDFFLEALAIRHREAASIAEEMRRQWDGWLRQAEKRGKERRTVLLSGDVLSSEANHQVAARTSFSEQQFAEAVRNIQEYISAGDVFQVNLSVRQSVPLHTDPSDIYEWLRILNPSPYMGYLKFPDFSLVCGSPELLVKLEDGHLITRPIAGTRPRGHDGEADRELAAELILNEKERAEHIMLVDLERNDIGRVAELGSVRVTDLMTIERYSHVMHIVSQVEGKLKAGLDAFDAIAATFPGGTITGAPKIRTMEIIEELEPVRRGPYTGSLGWIDYNGNMELNIIIRTLVAHRGWAHIQAGAGIVIDSQADKEYRESLNKAKALWAALHMSESIRMGVNELSHDFSH